MGEKHTTQELVEATPDAELVELVRDHEHERHLGGTICVGKCRCAGFVYDAEKRVIRYWINIYGMIEDIIAQMEPKGFRYYLVECEEYERMGMFRDG